MMHQKHISLSILSLVISLLFIPENGLAQKKIVEKVDSTALFKGVAVSVDLIGAGQLLLTDYGQYEGALRINLKDRYFPVVEIGYGKCNTQDETTQNSYKTDAPYARIGCDFNILKNKHDIYRLYLGGRYAFSSYKYDIYNPSITDPVWGGKSTLDAQNISGHYHWLELCAGIDAKIIGPLHLGWTVRYKQRLASKEGTVGDAWYVPGYGRGGKSRIGGTFHIIFEL